MKSFKILLGSLLVLGAANAFAADKIGVVNMQQLLVESAYAKQLKADIEREIKPLSNKLQTQAQKATKAQQDFDKNKATMSADQRRKAEQNLRDLVLQVRVQEANLNDELQAKEQDALKKLSDKVEAAIGDIRKKEGYTLIVRGEAVLYADDQYNITSQLLNALK